MGLLWLFEYEARIVKPNINIKSANDWVRLLIIPKIPNNIPCLLSDTPLKKSYWVKLQKLLIGIPKIWLLSVVDKRNLYYSFCQSKNGALYDDKRSGKIIEWYVDKEKRKKDPKYKIV